MTQAKKRHFYHFLSFSPRSEGGTFGIRMECTKHPSSRVLPPRGQGFHRQRLVNRSLTTGFLVWCVFMTGSMNYRNVV